MNRKNKKVLVTGGAGFIGSHCAEYYARKGDEVIVFDNLSRAELLKKDVKNVDFSWDYLKKFQNIELIKGDIRHFDEIDNASKGVDVIIHAAAQTAVTTSITNPEPDFSVNALGTFNVLEATRKNDVKSLIYCSTNKVYGENVNKIKVIEGQTRYRFEDKYSEGIPENFDVDLCGHTPYGCSKLTGDLYCQDYAHFYGLKTGVFRMSCIYGTRQFGVEDQGWLAWFMIASILKKPITIYGNGKQVRDVLYVSDLIELYDRFINSNLKHGVFNIGGGSQNTLSLLELLDILKNEIGELPKILFDNWRLNDQKVFISDINKAHKKLDWKPQISPKIGVKKLIKWIEANKSVF